MVAGKTPRRPRLLGIFLFFMAFPVAVSLPPVYWFAPFHSGGGYCSEAIGFLQALTLQNILVHIEQHGDSINYPFVQGLPLETQQLLQHAVQTRLPIEQSIAVCHSEPGAWYPPRYHTSRCPPSNALYRIGRTMFETDRLPSGWAERMSEDKMDEIWVPTAFHKQIFIDGGVDADRLQVVGEPVDIDFFSPHNPALLSFTSSSHSFLPPSLPPSSFLYLSVFKFEERKGYNVLLRAYFDAFNRGEDDVALLLLTNAYHSSDDFETPVSEIATKYFPDKPYPEGLPPVYIMSGVNALHLLALYQAADVFVLPSRGEGWGRPHVEAMAMETPIIATNWSGPTEFMTPTNSYPLRIDGLTEIKEGPFKGHMWAEPSVSHLTSLFRHTFTHREEGRERGREARRDMQALYSPAAMGEELQKHLERIERRVGGRKGWREEEKKKTGGRKVEL